MSEIKSYTEEREQADSPFHPTKEIEETYLLKFESQKKKQPLHLTGEETTLTSYLELDTWTPEQAACLVAGIKPETFTTLVVGHYSAWSLSGLMFMEKDAFLLDKAWKCGYYLDTKEMCGVAYEAFSQRTRVLELWNSRKKTRKKIKPSAFIAWCTKKNIDTTWLTEIDTHSGQRAPAATGKAVSAITSGNDWKATAWQIGKEILKKKSSLSVDQVAEKVYDEMTKRKMEPGMTGRGGRVPSANTIKRHALTGIKA